MNNNLDTWQPSTPTAMMLRTTPNCNKSVKSPLKPREGMLLWLHWLQYFWSLLYIVVSLVAVIIYSPLASVGDNTESSASTAGDNMLFRIQQLEAMLQGTNHSFKLLQESLESLEVQVQWQTDYDGNVSSQLLMQNNMLASHSSQITSMQSLIQTIQNNVRQDLDRLRTVNLYEGCINETRTCTITQSSVIR